jgi:nitroimidazol reductase NimA-like FMN-containing flavoprotein (pyridoxamine 5'-phosphate oxidase superfamily)
MKNVNETVRRQDRIMDESRAMEMLKNGDYGVLSIYDAETKTPYGVPVNYVWDGKDSIFIHCAVEGRKLRCIEKNPDVSFCIIGHTRVVPSKFTTERESVIFKGTAHFHLGDEEKLRALSLLVDKFSSEFKAAGMKYAEKSLHRVEIIRVDFTEWSGKCKY